MNIDSSKIKSRVVLAGFTTASGSAGGSALILSTDALDMTVVLVAITSNTLLGICAFIVAALYIRRH